MSHNSPAVISPQSIVKRESYNANLRFCIFKGVFKALRETWKQRAESKQLTHSFKNVHFQSFLLVCISFVLSACCLVWPVMKHLINGAGRPEKKRNYANVHVMDKRIRFHSPCLEAPGTSKLVPDFLSSLSLIKKREPGNEVGCATQHDALWKWVMAWIRIMGLIRARRNAECDEWPWVHQRSFLIETR